MRLRRTISSGFRTEASGGMTDWPPAENVGPGTMYALGLTIDSLKYSSGVRAASRHAPLERHDPS
jgi:hypothetical protein